MAGRERLQVVEGIAVNQIRRTLFPLPAASAAGLDDRATRPGSRSRRLHWLAVSLALCVADGFAILLCGVTSFALTAENGSADLLTCFVIAAAPIAAVGCLHGQDTYSRSAVLRGTSLQDIASGWLQASGLVLLVATAGVASHHWGRHDLGLTHVPSRLSQGWTLTFAASSLGALLLVRLGWSLVRRRFLRGDIVHHRVVVIGGGALAELVTAQLQADGDGGFEVVGRVDEDARADVAGDLPLLGSLAALPTLVEGHDVDTVVIAMPWAAGTAIHAAIRAASLCAVDIRLAAEPTAAAFLNRPLTRIADMPLLNVGDIPISGRSAVFKRLEDIAFASAVILAILPVLALIAVAIKLDSPGPVLFRQPRRGFGNRVFMVCKFRTMHTATADLGAAQQTRRCDPRVTTVGHFLRRHSFDELPQLFNVLLGDMSLVGPRPHALATTAGGIALEEALDTYAARHRVKPGITGLAQVSGWRGELDTREKLTGRVERDLWYIEHWSLLLDLKILARTFLCVVSDAHAY